MYGISQEVIERAVGMRGRLHCLERMDPARCALLVVDMQNYYLKPGFQAEIAAARDIVPAINRAARSLRGLGGRVVWILTAADGADRDWSFMHEYLMSPQRRARRMAELAQGSEGYALWPALETQADDLTVVKRRYSAFIQGSSTLERELRSRGIDTVLISGTSTNVCCESTARDAMMLDFRTAMLADALAAQNIQTHVGALANCLLHFGDVMNVDEALERMLPAAAQPCTMPMNAKS
ncbi:MAG: cysteine hydrolase [Betaproteobacteria bacterium]|nr:cysteine hydrolase [Betaproteobacteria bacterium]